MKLRTLSRCFGLIPSALATTAVGQSLQTFAKPQDLLVSDRHYVWATHYNVVFAKAITGADGLQLLDKAGNPLGAALSKKDFCAAAMEGTVSVSGASAGSSTNAVYNANGLGPTSETDCSSVYPSSGVRDKLGRQRFARVSTNARWGLGVAGYRLVPFRTIAVSSHTIQPGTALFIPALRGLTFTDENGGSFVHDGYVLAADAGDSIKNCHIDFFGGADWNEHHYPFTSGKLHPHALAAYVVHDSAVISALNAQHAMSSTSVIPSGNFTGCESPDIPPDSD